jgi:phosphoadenosine phosphosulfate reductase
VKHDVHYNNTTIDPPELTAYIRKYHPDVEMHYPTKSYFKEILVHGFPMRQNRWCCEYLKEKGGENRIVVTGIRAQESARRKKRRQFEYCNKRYVGKRFLHIILDWSVLEVWEYIKKNSLPYCELYNKGWNRIGCIACPSASYKNRIREMKEYPKIERAYKKAFKGLWEKASHRKSFKRWKSWEEMYHWWLTNESSDEDDGLFT